MIVVMKEREFLKMSVFLQASRVPIAKYLGEVGCFINLPIPLPSFSSLFTPPMSACYFGFQ